MNKLLTFSDLDNEDILLYHPAVRFNMFIMGGEHIINEDLHDVLIEARSKKNIQNRNPFYI